MFETNEDVYSTAKSRNLCGGAIFVPQPYKRL